MKQLDYCKIFDKLMLLTMTPYVILCNISDRASPFKLTIDFEVDLVECPLKTFVSTLANIKTFQSETALLAVSL